MSENSLKIQILYTIYWFLKSNEKPIDEVKDYLINIEKNPWNMNIYQREVIQMLKRRNFIQLKILSRYRISRGAEWIKPIANQFSELGNLDFDSKWDLCYLNSKFDSFWKFVGLKELMSFLFWVVQFDESEQILSKTKISIREI